MKNRKCGYKCTYNSNAIEENTLILRETDMVLRGLTIDRKLLKEHMEAVGHKEAFDFVRDLVKDQVLCRRIVTSNRFIILCWRTNERTEAFTEESPSESQVRNMNQYGHI